VVCRCLLRCLGAFSFSTGIGTEPYQAELFRKGKSPGTVRQRLAALRFFYVKTLRRAWSLADTPYPKKAHHLPTVLSREEVAQLLRAARAPRQRILLMTLYATGARRSELTHLKISDIDSQRMVVHIRGGKGRKDRDVMLSPKLLAALRTHWRYYHRKFSTWLFPSNYRKDRPIDTKTVWYACQKAAQRAGLQKRVHPHTLRHYSASPTITELPETVALWPKLTVNARIGLLCHSA